MRLPVCAAAILISVFAARGRAQIQLGGTVEGQFIVLNSATEGQPYSYQFTVTGGTPPYTWSALAPIGEGFIALPSGLSLNAQTGLLSGTPAVEIDRTSYFTVSVTDSSPEPQSAQLPVGIKIFPPLPLTIHSTLPAGITGNFYTGSIQAAGGVPPLSITITGLPQGLQASPSGAISGVVNMLGTYSVNVTVRDAIEETISQMLSLPFYAPAPFTATGSSGTVTVNLPYSLSLTASGGNAPYSWTLMSGTLPPGLTLHAAGYIDGTPAATGQYQFTLQATDAGGRTATSSYSIQVTSPPLAPTIPSLPVGFVNLSYQQQILSVGGGTPPYTFSLQTGSNLPPGLTLSNGSITGVPTSAGTTRFTILATDSSSPAVSIPITYTLVIAQATTPQPTLSTAALSFSTSTGSQTPPSAQNIAVNSTDGSTNLSLTVSVDPPAPWLNALPSSISPPNTLAIGINQTALPAPSATPYATTITFSCAGCIPATQTVTVSLLVTALPGTLAVPDTLVSFVAAGPTPTLSGSITVQDTGGGPLGIGEITCGAPWCTLGSFGYTVAAGSSEAIPITVDPSTLQPGFYRTSITVQSSGGSATVPVDLLYTNGSLITLNPAAVRFDMNQGSAPPEPNRSFAIDIPQGQQAINWTAAVQPGAPWLQLATPGGTAQPGSPGVVQYSIVPGAGGQTLGVGAYYGTIRVTAPGTANSPFDFQVVLNVNPANDVTDIDPEPAGLLFVTSPGVDPPDQGVQVYTTSASPIAYSAGVTAATTGNWLSVDQTSGTISVNSPADSDMGVAAGTLGSGVYRGGVSYAVGGGSVRNVNVTLVVQPVASGQSAAAQSAGSARSNGASFGKPPGNPGGQPIGAASAASCTPTQLAPTQTGLVNNFSAPAAWPTPLTILLADDCGNSVTNGQVVTTFSNGDPPLALPLVNAASGLYSATWTPRGSASQVNVLATATAPGFAPAQAVITGSVPANAVPLIAPNGAVHPYDPETGGPLAPGTIMSIYGTNLSSATGQPSAIPLPTSFNNTSVIIGGVTAPLFYVSPSQINAQIPYQLGGNNQYQVIVTTNGAVSAPQPIQLAQATPGIAAFPDGTVIAQHADGSLVSATSPATPGEYLVMYLLGLGDTNTPVTSGDASPSSPLAEPLDTPTLLLNNSPIPVAFSGLTPGLVGLYQMNFQVPAGLAAGSYSLQVTQNNLASNTVTFPVQP